MAPKNKVAPPKSAPKTPAKQPAKPAAPQRTAAPPKQPAKPVAQTRPPAQPQRTAASPQRAAQPPARTAAPAQVQKPAQAQPQRAAAPASPPARQVNAPPRQSPQPGAAMVKAQPAPVVASAPASSAPAWLQKQMSGHAPKGLEVVDREDLIMPRLSLVQKTSPIFDEGRAAIGDIVDNVTGEVLAQKGEMLEVIPVVVSKSRIYFHPYNEGGGIDCRAPDGITALPGGIGQDMGGQPTTECANCVFSKWDETAENGKPPCSNIINILVMLPSRNYSLYALSFKSTGIKVSKRLLSTIKQTGVDAFALKFGVFAVDDQSANNQFQNWDFQMIGYVSETEYVKGSQTFAGFEGKTWEANMEDLAATGGEESADLPPAPDQSGDFGDVQPADEPPIEDAQIVDEPQNDAQEPPPPSDADAPPADGDGF